MPPTRTAAHSCLVISEILSIAFSFASPGTLASLARVCKDFREPAFSALYRSLPSIEPLIRCMPEDLWALEEVWAEDLTSQLKLRRAMRASDWAIFQKYAIFVQEITFGGNKALEVDINVFHALTFPPFPPPLLPKLKSLTWRERHEETYPLIRFLLGPALSSIFLSMDPLPILGRVPIVHALPCIATMCPQIKTLHLAEFDWRAETMEVASRVLPEFFELEKLTSGMLDRPALLHLSQLQTLSSLSLFVPVDKAYQGIKRWFKKPAFPGLRILCMTGYKMDSFLGFVEVPKCAIDTMDFTSLRDSPLNAGAVPKILALCPSQSIDQSVTSISIYLHDVLNFDSVEAVHSDYAISFDDLKPVLTLHKIRYFTLDINYPFSLDDMQLRELAMAWPELVALDLGSTHGWRKPSAITLPGLLPLFQHCPNLDHLGIVIDASRLAYELPADDIQARNLSFVEFSNSRIRAPAAVAAFLACVMPQIREIYAWHTSMLEDQPEAQKYQKRWSQVEKILRAMAKLRRREEDLSYGVADRDDQERISDGEFEEWDTTWDTLSD